MCDQKAAGTLWDSVGTGQHEPAGASRGSRHHGKVPSSWRDVQVTHMETGETETVQMRIAGIGTRWDVPGAGAWATTDKSWSYYWHNGAPPCQGVNYLAASTTFALFFWIVPEGAGACSVTPGLDIPRMSYRHLQLHLAGRAHPHRDPPARRQPRRTIARRRLAGLAHRGRQPSRLFRDQTFSIFASGRFKMNLECGLAIGNTCGLRNGAGDAVPLQVGVSLPFGLNDQHGQAVNKLPLRLDGSGSELFQAQHLYRRCDRRLGFGGLGLRLDEVKHPGQALAKLQSQLRWGVNGSNACPLSSPVFTCPSPLQSGAGQVP